MEDRTGKERAELQSGDKKMGFVGDSDNIELEREMMMNLLYTHASAFGVFFITCKRLVKGLLFCFFYSLCLSLPFAFWAGRAASRMYMDSIKFI